MDLDRAMHAARNRNQSVLVTMRRDGRPQLSNVVHTLDPDSGVIRISTTADRAKYANLRRQPWAALHVNGDDFWSYAVLECDVELSSVAAEPTTRPSRSWSPSTEGSAGSTTTGTSTAARWCATGASSCG